MPTRIPTRSPRGDDGRPAAILTEREQVAPFLEDAAHTPGGHAPGVAFPRTEADVARLLREHPRVLAVGAQSSLTGGATPLGELVLSTERFDRVTIHAPDRVTVGAGVSLERLSAALAPHGLRYPPLPTYLGACAGGVVATNAAGPATFKYGTTRAWVEALTGVLATGDVLDLERGALRAGDDGVFVFDSSRGEIRVQVPRYTPPDTAKCSAGYHAGPGMDPIDLFVGSEGTLCVITEITLRLTPAPRGDAWLLVATASEAQALQLVTGLREASVATRRTGDPAGLDVAAIEHLDARSLALLREDGTDRRLRIGLPEDTSVLLLAHLELQEALSRSVLMDQVSSALESGGADGPIARLCRILDRHGLLDRAEIVAGEDVGRVRQLIALREAVPATVNARIAQARAGIDPRIEKTAADMIVPFARFDSLLARSRQVFERRGLDYAVWGHVSDGNVHPNALPRSWEEVELARDAILELGRAAIAMGGSPLAEHGVGRNPVKQRLLRELYGEPGLADMRAVKSALDPAWTLAPGVIFTPAS